MFDRIKDILFKIKDYDRLEHDYSTCLWYFTDGLLSKTNYEIKTLEAVLGDTISRYVEEGYSRAEKDIIALIESRISEILGDAQPHPALRAELQEIIKRIKEEYETK